MILKILTIVIIVQVLGNVGSTDNSQPEVLRNSSLFKGQINSKRRPASQTPKWLGRKLKMVGGADAPIKKHPYVASVRRNGTHFCTGSIVHKLAILTSAYCAIYAGVAERVTEFRPTIDTKQTTDISVQVGSSELSKGGKIYEVKTVEVHPKFKSVHDHNVALLVLETPIEFNEDTRRIKLFRSGEFLSIDDTVTLLGWGSNNTNNTIDKLESIDVEVVDFMLKCFTVIKSEKAMSVTNTSTLYLANFCTYTPGKGPCFDALGGPVVHKKRQSGIVSWFNGWDSCSTNESPDVHIAIGYYRAWIGNKIDSLEKAALLPSVIMSPRLIESSSNQISAAFLFNYILFTSVPLFFSFNI